MADCIRCIPGLVGERDDEGPSSVVEEKGAAEAFRTSGAGRVAITALLSGNWNPRKPS